MKATAYHDIAQKIEGSPVSDCMLPASYCALGLRERTKKSRRLKSGLRTHCIARKLTRKLRTRGGAYLAAARRPSEIMRPETTVKGLNERLVNGTRKPKTIGSPRTKAAEATSTALAVTRLRTS